MAENQNFMAWE